MLKNYIVLAHKNPAQLARLITRLDDGNSKFYLHIDGNSRLEDFEDITNNKCVVSLKARIKCAWGDFSLVAATLLGMAEIIAEGRGGYTILLSGQDYPLRSNSAINDYLERNDGVDFIDCRPIHDVWPDGYEDRVDSYRFMLSKERGDGITLPYILSRKYLNPVYVLNIVKRLLKRRVGGERLVTIFSVILKKRKKPSMNWYGGSQWFALSQRTLAMVYDFHLAHPEYGEYHRFTQVPDEIFFQTIVMKLKDEDSTIRVAPSTTYVNWSRRNVPLPVTFTRSDLSELESLGDGYLFARKFDTEVCSEILNVLDRTAG